MAADVRTVAATIVLVIRQRSYLSSRVVAIRVGDEAYLMTGGAAQNASMTEAMNRRVCCPLVENVEEKKYLASVVAFREKAEDPLFFVKCVFKQHQDVNMIKCFNDWNDI